jgi:hypothetical protein
MDKKNVQNEKLKKTFPKIFSTYSYMCRDKKSAFFQKNPRFPYMM